MDEPKDGDSGEDSRKNVGNVGRGCDGRESNPALTYLLLGTVRFLLACLNKEAILQEQIVY